MHKDNTRTDRQAASPKLPWQPCYRPGHDVHWIQWNKARNDKESWEPGLLLRVSGRILFVLHQNGRIGRYRTVHADRAYRKMHNRTTGEVRRITVRVCLRWHVIALPPNADRSETWLNVQVLSETPPDCQLN